jgi:hypothetical protein
MILLVFHVFFRGSTGCEWQRTKNRAGIAARAVVD